MKSAMHAEEPSRRRLFFGALFVLGAALLASSGAVGYRFYLRTHPDARSQLKVPPRFAWRSIERRHWQAVSPDAPKSEDPGSGRCGKGMIEVDGLYLQDPFGTDLSGHVEELQNKTCTNWISRDFPARCQSFDRASWLELSASLPRRSLTFCMDRFEYPNVRGENPVIVVTFGEAQTMCRGRGKRLCTESEWTLACEGEEGQPYPYGYERSSEACTVDRPWRPFKEGGLAQRDSEGAREELDRLWQGLPSGSRPSCKSSYGVYDLTGNVDEWTQSVRSEGFASILKGGYWGPVRARCRPSTRAHNEQFVAYQQGFRCCSDIAGVPAAGALVERARMRNVEPGREAASALAHGHGSEDIPKAVEDMDEALTLGDFAAARPDVGAGVGLACSAGRRAEDGFGLDLAYLAGLAILLLRPRRVRHDFEVP